MDAFGTASPKAFIGFTEAEVEHAAELGPADVLLLHDWPAGVVEAPSLADVAAAGRAVAYRQPGNAPARLLVDLLAPRLVLCGHMHTRLRAELRAGSARVPIACLASLHEGKDGIAVFRRGDDGTLEELAI